MTALPLVGTVLHGKFQIEKALASGAAGDVYEAVHLGLGSRVAVKVLRQGIPETAEIRRRRFMREARVAARIQSNNVVRVFDIVAPEEGPTYIVMELLQGETLAERVRRIGPLPIGDAVEYVMQAARPLGVMHDAGIVHRDVKPSNLFLAHDTDGGERIKLLDFGVAAFQHPVARDDGRQSSLTLSEAMIGTPRYMAPEQVRGSGRVDGRADVWALGVTLYELLSGVPPFDGKTVLAVCNQIELQDPPPLQARRSDVPAELAAVVHRCLAKDPSRRPADARAVAAALAPFASGSSASPASSPTPSMRPPAEDPLDLSLSDDNVEVLESPAAAAKTAVPSLRRRALAIAALAGVVSMLVLVASRRPSAPEAESRAAASSVAPSPPLDVRRAEAPATSVLTVATTVTPPAPSAREAPAPKRAPDSPRPSSRAGSAAPARPPVAKPTSPSRTSIEADDRIE